jgi:Pentapeptide repeats (8 copies)
MSAVGRRTPDLRSGRSEEDAEPPIAPGAESFAKKADDLESIRGAVDDAAAVGGALWFSYLFVLFYLAVAAGAVTHADLFLENPVKLPFLNIDLPLLAFFSLAPILFLFAHGYTLMHLVMLTEKAKDYDQALREQIGADSPATDKLRRQLPSNIFIQYLAGPAKLRKSAFGYALGFVAFTTLAVAPLLLLLMMQLQFLPFHSSFITWTQRVVLILDLALIWWLWGTIRSGREIGGNRGALFRAGRVLGLATGFVLTVGAILFSAAVATFPGEWQEDHLPSAQIFPAIKFGEERDDQSTQQAAQSVWDWAKGYWNWVRTSEKVSLHDWVFRSAVDETSRRRWLPFSNTLVLPGFNVLEGLGIDDPKKAEWRDFVFRARGRDLSGARFDFASLPRVDFTGAQLQGASLQWAQLDHVSFEKAHLEGAYLGGAQLPGGNLRSAQLQGAWLQEAQLQGASLDDARLQGAYLTPAQLQGASLVAAQLQGASLQSADMEATDLTGALLWRSHGDNAHVANIRLIDLPDTWRPIWIDENFRVQKQWEGGAYESLRKMIESLQTGGLRNDALVRIRILDCANPDKTLASCDTSLPIPPEASAWRKSLEDARVADPAYTKALASVLKALVCSGADNALYILRNPAFTARLSAAYLSWSKKAPSAADLKAPGPIDVILERRTFI